MTQLIDGLRPVFQQLSIVEQMLGMIPGIQKEAECILFPRESTFVYVHDFVFIVFLGMELNLLLHDILYFNI